MGWLTIMIDTNSWSAEQHMEAKKEIELYKKELRPLIRDASLYHISSRPDGVHWDGMEYWDASQKRGVVYAFRGTIEAEKTHTYRLNGLNPMGHYRLKFHDRSSPDRTATGRELMNAGLTVKYLRADLKEPTEIHNAVGALRKYHDRIDVLVNNAGIEMEKPLTELTVADWDLVLNVNLRGAFLLTQAAVPLFPESGGAIVNISSIHASHAFPASIPYACSKAAMVALTRNLALELAPKHIRVNCVPPGYIDTRL